MLEERGDEVVFFDGRNAFEAKIGVQESAIVPDVRTTHDFIRLRSSPASTITLRTSRSSPRTGGTTEILSALHEELRGFGIYSDRFASCVTARSTAIRNCGRFALTFDKRMHMEFTPDTVTIGSANSVAPLEQVRELPNDSRRSSVLLWSRVC